MSWISARSSVVKGILEIICVRLVWIAGTFGSDADQNCGGVLQLFNPASTTYVKHFVSNIQYSQSDDYSVCAFVAGYGNTTSAIDAVQFKFSSGNIDDGIIKLYGVKKS